MRYLLFSMIMAAFLAAGDPPPRPDLWRQALDLSPGERSSILRRALDGGLPPEEEGLVRLVLGRNCRDSGESDRALEYLSDESVLRTPLGEYGLLMRVELLEAEGRDEECIPLLGALFDWGGEATYRREAAVRLAEDAVERDAPGEAAPFLEYVVREGPDDPESLLWLTEALLAAGRTSEAEEKAAELWARFPATSAVRSFFEDHPELEPETSAGGDPRVLQRLRSLDRQQAWWRLKRELPGFEPATPEQRARFDYLQGRAMEADGAYGSAMKLYGKAFEASSETAGDSLDRIGRILTRAGLPGKQVQAWEDRVADLDPQEFPQRETVLARWMRRRMQLGQMSRALEIARRILDKSPGQRNACELLYEEAWDAWRNGRRRTFRDHLRVVADHAPEGDTFRQASLYSLLRLGLLEGPEADSARSELARTSRFGYFGYRIRGGDPEGERPSTAQNPAVAPVDSRSHRGKAELLLALGFREEALKEFRLALAAGPDPALHWSLARLSRELGDIPSSVRSARKAFPDAYGDGGDAVPPEVWRAFYPIEWKEAVLAAAGSSNLPPEMVCAVIRQESLWDPCARSPAGALGLMQLLPGTARSVASRIGLKGPVEVSLLSPEWNTRAGAAYFSSVLEEFGGRVDHALAAYNAGPGRVRRWLVRPGCPEEPDLFIESIPFFETRTYVRMVLLNYWEYRRLYEEFSDPIPDRFGKSLRPGA